MQNLFAYFSAQEQVFAAYLKRLAHYHQRTGNLPTIPNAPMTNADVARATLPNVDAHKADVTVGPEGVVPPPPIIPPTVEPPKGGYVYIPDENGNIDLDHYIAAPWQGWRFQIAEVTSSLKGGDQAGKAFANLTHANGLWTVGNMNFIGTCYECTQAQDGSWAVDTSRPIHQTQSWPDTVLTASDGTQYNLGTLDGVVAWCNHLGKPPGLNK